MVIYNSIVWGGLVICSTDLEGEPLRGWGLHIIVGGVKCVIRSIIMCDGNYSVGIWTCLSYLMGPCYGFVDGD